MSRGRDPIGRPTQPGDREERSKTSPRDLPRLDTDRSNKKQKIKQTNKQKETNTVTEESGVKSTRLRVLCSS